MKRQMMFYNFLMKIKRALQFMLLNVVLLLKEGTNFLNHIMEVSTI